MLGLGMEFTAAEVAAAAGGRIVAGDPAATLSGVTIDSRRVPRGSLFVPLPGSRVDGHEFIPAALAAGAHGYLTMRPEGVPAAAPWGEQAVAIAVGDALSALQSLAAAWRGRLAAQVIGIAGSNGKTTTKQVLASVLASRLITFATPGNENSQIGAPLTLLATPLDTEALVLELGTSAPGELARLAAIARPDLAIITAAEAEHLEWLGDLEGVIAAETEILDALPPGRAAFVGAAEPRLARAARRRAALRIQTVGTAEESDYHLRDVHLERDGTSFTIEVHVPHPAGTAPGRFHVPLVGMPAALAASFAAAVGRELGLDDPSIQAGLDLARPAAHRLVALRHASLPLFVLDDCYNANPASSLAAIDTAVSLRTPGDRLVLVLGDMLELGPASDGAHRDLGAAIRAHAPDVALHVTVGPAARLIAAAARRDGIAVREVDDSVAAANLLTALVADRRPTTLLVKASRGLALERVIERLWGGQAVAPSRS